MSTAQLDHDKKSAKPSKLEQFSLGFEFNETWTDARKKYASNKK